MLRYFIVFLFLLLETFSRAQNQPTVEQSKTIHDFYNAYNNRDYAAMRSQLHWVMKLVFKEKTIEEIYGNMYSMMGPVEIVDLRSTSSSGVLVETRYLKDITETDKTGYSFSGKNKIMGMGSSSQKYRYKKTDGVLISDAAVASRIDSLVKLKNEVAAFSGCVMVIREGNVIYKGCAGEADRDSHLPLHDSSLFDLASCSKQFTAMGILQLSEREMLTFSDDVRKYIPELPYDGITIHHLLTHTSGLPEYFELLDKHWDKSRFATNEDVVEMLKKHHPKPINKPGKAYEYCNTGYVLLAVLIERISGMSYGDFLSANIFVPLGMVHSRVYNTRRSGNEELPNHAIGYTWSERHKKYIVPDSLPEYDFVNYMDAITGDGTVNSCLNDLVLWEKALRSGQLISSNTLELAFTKAKLNSGDEIDYGYGWELQRATPWEHVAYHSGSWPGYLSIILHFMHEETSVVILTNNEYIGIQKFANRIAEMMLHQPR